MLKVLSLFSGIGAFEKALTRQDIPFELVNYCEFDKYASRSYAAVHEISEEMNLWDVRTIDTDKLPDFDLMTWGFPCQDISVAGKQRGIKEGTRSGLYYEGYRILKAKRPAHSIIENVKNLVGEGHRDSFIQIIKDIRELGYNCYWKVLNAKDFGIPQNRERIFIVSIRRDVDKWMGWEGLFPWPQPFDNGLRLVDFLETEVDEKYYISDEKTAKLLEQIKNKNISNTIRSSGRGSYERHQWDLVSIGNVNPSGNGMNGNVYAGNCSPTLTTNKGEGLKIIEVGKLNSSQDGVVVSPYGISKTHTSGHNNSPKVLQIGRRFNDGGLHDELPSMTKNSFEQNNFVFDYRVRRLTPLECWRLMGFDDEDFYKAAEVNSNSQLYKQAGNSIVVNVLEEIFKGLFK